MLKRGLYISENNESIFNAYTVKMIVKETESNYIFELVELKSRYSATHIEMLFDKKKKVRIKKYGSGHSMRIWGDDNFTLYPYQSGIPYYFCLFKGGNKDEL